MEAYKSVGWYSHEKYIAMKYSYHAGNDFRRIKDKYHTAVANGAYVYPYVNKDGDQCVMVYVSYKIQTNWNAFYSHNITQGTYRENPGDYYSKKANDYWGNSRIYYLDLAAEALKAQTKALEGFLGKIDTGVFVDAKTLNM